MERVSIVALMAIIVGISGCCCRRQPATPVAACAPAPMCPNPCGPGAVTYGYGSSYGMPATTTYMPVMQ